MENNIYKKLMKKAPFGYAYHRIITNRDGTPVDYEYIEMNKSFEELTGLKAKNTVGRKVTEVLPGIKEDEFDWIKSYGDIALNGGEKEFKQYSKPLGRWYKVQAFSPEKMYFSTVFIDITSEKEKTEELERFFSVNLDLLCIADTEGNFIKINKAWETILGYPAEKLEKSRFLDFVHPEDIDATIKAVSELSRQKPVLDFVNRYRTHDGSYRYIEWRSHPYGTHIYAAARDITERVKASEEIRNQNSFQKIVAEISSDFISSTMENIEFKIEKMIKSVGVFFNADRAIITRFSGADDRKRKVEYVNEWCGTGIVSAADYIKKIREGSLTLLIKESEENRYLYVYDTSKPAGFSREGTAMINALSILSFFAAPVIINEKIEGYFTIHFVKRNCRLEESQIALLKVITNILSDALGRNKLEQELLKASITDPLTALFNRRHLFSRLYQLAEESRRRKTLFSVIMFDIDYFKKLNDTEGHSAGDYVLQQFARIMKENVRVFDILCRYGGEEFLAVIVGTGKNEALSVSERILHSVRNSIFDFGGREIRVTVSCGIADSFEMIEHKLSPELLIDIADKRLYIAKSSGRDRCVISGG